MRHISGLSTLSLVWAFALASSAWAQDAGSVETKLIGHGGAVIGTVSLTGNAHGTVVRIVTEPGSVPTGWHGLHFHAVADCSDTESFMASKGHINHDGKKHGLLNADGPEDGDLPNVYAAADGTVHAEVTTGLLLAGPHGLLESGAALVMHANPDDHQTQPIGGAGARFACAPIKG